MTPTARLAASFVLVGALGLAACQHPSAPRPQTTPTLAATAHAGVGAANPLAVEAGLEVLRAGGNAVDAAVAVQAALGLVEPQSSGLGGGAFLVFFDAKAGKVTAFEGREAAPAGATPDMFIGPDGKPLSFPDAVMSGRSTGAPGAIAMLGLAHEKFGRLPWRSLFGTATRAAGNGFTVPKRLGRYAGGNVPQAALPDARSLFEEDVKKFERQYVEGYEITVLDEVQYCRDAGSKLKYLADKGRKIWLTSSSEVILGKEILSYLVGRVSILRLYPFSLPEFLLSKGLKELTPDTAQRSIWEHIAYGGYPKAVIPGPSSCQKRQSRSSTKHSDYQDYFFSFPVNPVKMLGDEK